MVIAEVSSIPQCKLIVYAEAPKFSFPDEKWMIGTFQIKIAKA